MKISTKPRVSKLFSILACIVILSLIIVVCFQCNMISQQEKDTTETYEWCKEIDKEYIEALQGAESNYDRATVNSQFSERWLECAERYYNLIILNLPYESSEDDFISPEKWIEYKDMQVKEFLAYADNRSLGGTINAVLAAEYEYNLCRERAVELYQMYIEIKETYDSMPWEKTKK